MTRIRLLPVLVLLLLAAAAPTVLAQTPAEVIADVRVHGNHVTTSEEILTIGGVTIGAPFTATTLQEVDQRLRKSGKLDDVQVLKRYASPGSVCSVVLSSTL